ncbi:MAG TPA: DUF2062 domain-containing protein [Anaerohalosphaeraceae bacterium]|nr:DUF2062 domain-containing protein [Anaerohalosphaeraceae bacterium]HOL89604.1 DUF2062 domain-containing protein [Anaerohalosphaeraceae bacterium]HPP55080.1 DUF2062 domain-containing protein [Anaerohalosphaeraceae bacterium]
MWLRLWRRKQASIRQTLKGSRLHRFWGQTLFHDLLWRTNRRSIAGGLALGLFIAFTPTIPFQMTLAVIGALFLKVNLPIAIAACWITNPLTALPVYTAAWKLGKYLIEHIGIIHSFLETHRFEPKSAHLILNGIYLWTGSLIFSILAAVLGTLLVLLLWKMPRSRRRKRQTDSLQEPGLFSDRNSSQTT